MDQTSSDRIDESTLTKGQVRKLNALRKSVGEEIGERTFAAWLASQGAADEKADGNAALVIDTLWPLIEQGTAGDPARRLPAETRARPDHRRAGAVDRSTVVRGVLTPLQPEDPRRRGPFGCAGAGFESRLPRGSLSPAAGGAQSARRPRKQPYRRSRP